MRQWLGGALLSSWVKKKQANPITAELLGCYKQVNRFEKAAKKESESVNTRSSRKFPNSFVEFSNQEFFNGPQAVAEGCPFCHPFFGGGQALVRLDARIQVQDFSSINQGSK